MAYPMTGPAFFVGNFQPRNKSDIQSYLFRVTCHWHVTLPGRPILAGDDHLQNTNSHNKKDCQKTVFFINRQLPILPGRLQPSTFGVYVLNYCVRNGNRWDHIAIITGYSSLSFFSITSSFRLSARSMYPISTSLRRFTPHS